MLVDRPDFNKLTGIYLGSVVKHLSHGKCKVFIPGVYPDSYRQNLENLPDAQQASPLFGGANHGNGCFSYPNIGATVLCIFLNGDQNYPVYFASLLGGVSANVQFDEARPNVTEDTIADGTDAYVHIVNCGKSRVKIWETGSIEIYTGANSADTDEKSAAKLFIDETGNISITASQQISLDAPVIKLNATSQMDIVSPVFSNINGVSNNVISPSINLDASTGMAAIKGKKHTAIYN